MNPFVFMLIVGSHAFNLEDSIYADYKQISYEYSKITLVSGSHTAKKSSMCINNILDTETVCRQDGCNCISISVSNPSPPTMIGCDMLLPYYKTSAISFQETMGRNAQIMQQSTDQQDNLQLSSTTAENWIIDAYNVEQFCRELGASRRIRRSLWEEFLKTTKIYAKALLKHYKQSDF